MRKWFCRCSCRDSRRCSGVKIRLCSEEDRDGEEDDNGGGYASGFVAAFAVDFPPMIRRPSTILTTSTRYTFSTGEIYEIKDYDDDEEEKQYKHRTNQNECMYKYEQNRV